MAALIALVTAIVYWRTSSFGFVTFDDNDYVYKNDVVLRGLTGEGIAWAWSGAHFANWHPLTWMSHMLDVSLFGLDAGKHHLVAVVLHAIAAALLFAVLARMTGAVGGSSVVALLFALHPLHVESVAWIAERKDVLSGVFWMLALFLYAKAALSPGRLRIGLTAMAMAAGIVSKQMVVTLPVVLLLLDYWPLSRLRDGAELRSRIAEKLPLFALSALGSIVAITAQRSEAVVSLESIPVGLRIANAIHSYAVYLGQMVWPVNLSVFYPYDPELPAIKVATSAIVLAAISGFAWAMRRRAPYVIVGWLWYLVTLLPVIGIIQVGSQAHADRYTYLPLIGIFIALIWGAGDVARRFAIPSLIPAITAAVILIACSVATFRQLAHWRDGVTLFTRAVAVTRDNAVAYSNLGMAHLELQMIDEAATAFRRAVQIDPEYTFAFVNLGNALARQQKIAEAIAAWERAIQLDPKQADVRNNLAVGYASQGRMPEARAHVARALEADPRFVPAILTAARLAAAAADYGEARRRYEQALAIDPANDQAGNELRALP